MDHWYAGRVASYVDDLKATKDSEGKSLFDRTAVAWFNELGEGPDHSHNDKPHTIIGSLGGYFKTGQLVRYPKDTPHIRSSPNFRASNIRTGDDAARDRTTLANTGARASAASFIHRYAGDAQTP